MWQGDNSEEISGIEVSFGGRGQTARKKQSPVGVTGEGEGPECLISE